VEATGESHSLIGLVIAYEANHWAGHCYLAFQRAAQPAEVRVDTKGLLTEGILLLVEYVFDHFAFHKVYFDVPEYNLSLMVGANLLKEEGIMRDHFFFAGRRWDNHVMAIYRSDFEPLAEAFHGGWDHE